MLNEAVKQLKTGFILLLLLIGITGGLYPLLVTGFAQLVFPWEANGSLIKQQGQYVGSALIGQSFAAEQYFWGRPSATSPFAYNGAASSGSNSGPSNLNFLATVENRVYALKQANALDQRLIPVDLVTASGSGLDPDISPYAAFYQVARVAKARHLSKESIRDLIQSQRLKRTFSLLGEPRINVLQLNLALDTLRINNG